jgi:hypothetical protein
MEKRFVIKRFVDQKYLHKKPLIEGTEFTKQIDKNSFITFDSEQSALNYIRTSLPDDIYQVEPVHFKNKNLDYFGDYGY